MQTSAPLDPSTTPDPVIESHPLLFAQAGFNLTRIVPTQGIVSIVEGMRI